jgi:Carboxypeptidase regulatory-like domain
LKDKWRNSAGRHFLAGLSAVLLIAIGASHGPTPGAGAISGVVYDPGNRVVANAEVLATTSATHTSRSAVTASEGVFRLPLLPPEVYNVSVIPAAIMNARPPEGQFAVPSPQQPVPVYDSDQLSGGQSTFCHSIEQPTHSSVRCEVSVVSR